MASAVRAMRENARLVDVVIEVVDARAPSASRNPGLFRLVKKPTVIAMAKADLADRGTTDSWRTEFESRGTLVFPVNCRTGEGVSDLLRGCRQVAEASPRGPGRLVAGGGRKRPLRAMVVGLPNVGKSSLVNKIASSAAARTGARPGVTRGKQWVRTGEGVEVLDLPGVVMPGRSDPRSVVVLALLGIVEESSYDPVEVAARALRILRARSPSVLKAIGVGVATEPTEEAYDGIRELGKRLGFVSKGGEVDIVRASSWLIRQVRDGKIGRLSLESPPGEERDA
jgi:ribosome biogenesis GTPase A